MADHDDPDDAAGRAQALADVLAGLMAVAFGEDCDCTTCRRLRDMDRVLQGHEPIE